MKFDCTTPRYAQLYARWLDNAGSLLDRAKMQTGDRVLDLCGGTGAVSRVALDRGALEVVLLDLAPRADHLKHLSPLFVSIRGRAEDMAKLLPTERFDLVICRQAIGYLDPEAVAAGVQSVLRPGGKFVFNTFKRPRWQAKTYIRDGDRFFELSGYLRDHVVHVQASPRFGMDVTKFRWHRNLNEVMSRYFMVTEEVEDRSVYYVCRKKFGGVPVGAVR